ncbi:hypothetical protein EG328_003587 [Venturia inaequalis]|uniref:Secreted protein n=1 Tax=Venturia inaequalis TaxID=5025 RepID=A0A8H3YZR7_VENIN|nr:hypothetical protein EG328_003587 [Venturia inaequalis]RDI80187.1 hypothetical protein Vi05172_g9868 [Venturia inaequalis]
MAATYQTTPLAQPPLNASDLPAAEAVPQTHNNGEPSTRPVPAAPPAFPPRPADDTTQSHAPQDLPSTSQFEPPPRRRMAEAGDSTGRIEYTREPERLIAYLVPFPTPDLSEGFLQTTDPVAIPHRFLIYTPPPPPLLPPKEGEKERKLGMHHIQRKWQGEVRKAKTDDVEKKSWRGIRYMSSRAVDRGICWITTSNVDFLCRIPKNKKKGKGAASTTTVPADGTTGAVGTSGSGRLEELVLVHPESLPGTRNEVQREFISSLQRSKKRAYRDAVISILLFPPAIVIDTIAVIIWPFGGLAEIDGVWAVYSIRGAKRARSVTKRLDATPQKENPDDSDDEDPKADTNAKHNDKKLKLTFAPTERLEILRRYLAAECHKRDPKLFKHAGEGTAPTESQVLEALGWTPSGNTTVGEKRNMEDEQWEIRQAKEDLQVTMEKGATEWMKWCKTFQKKPEKALKK